MLIAHVYRWPGAPEDSRDDALTGPGPAARQADATEVLNLSGGRPLLPTVSSSSRCHRGAMSEDSRATRRLLRRAAGRAHHGARRRFPMALIGLLSLAVLLVTPGLASADTSSTLTILGTSDVSDSGLVAKLIQPEFEQAYPQFTFNYLGDATGAAIAEAESGALGASALIVDAPSLENQFVALGYSSEPYGRAIFTTDFVLAGPQSDPAGV